MGQVSWIEYIGAVLFFLALVHTFSTKYFVKLATKDSHHTGLWLMLGEVEVVFGFWAFILLAFMAAIGGYEALSNILIHAILPNPYLFSSFWLLPERVPFCRQSSF